MIKKAKKLKKEIKRIVSIRKDIRDGLARLSYSQEGEDVIIASLLEKSQNGFFIDVGAHHPKRFSNTYMLYQRGWCGINIGPTPGCMALFNRTRPRDINLEIGIASEHSKKAFFVFEEGAPNTFDPILAKERQKSGWTLLQESTVTTYPLSTVLCQYCLAPVGLLNVDAEGFDLEVLQSNDWATCRPLGSSASKRFVVTMTRPLVGLLSGAIG